MELVVPLMLAAVAVYGLVRRVNIFDAFIEGAREGIHTLYTIAPTMIGLLAAVGMFRASGALDVLTDLIRPLAEMVGFPVELVPMALLRPVSGSGATALLTDIYARCGADSFSAKCASVLAGSTETTFYAIGVYYAAAGIKKTRHTLISALLADLTAIIMSVVTVSLFRI